MAGAELQLLQNPGQIRRVNRRPHRLAAMSINDTQRLWREAAGGVNHVRDQRLASQRMEYLGQVRMHALALAGSENDDIHELELCQTVRLVFLSLAGTAVSTRESWRTRRIWVVRRQGQSSFLLIYYFRFGDENSQQRHA
jgi:hypothetical protein